MRTIITFIILISLNLVAKAQLNVLSSGNVGIGITSPLSKLSVGDAGGTQYEGFFLNPSTTGSLSIGLAAQALPNGARCQGLSGFITLNTSANINIGTWGSSYSSTPLSNGRSYGIYGYAGNATSGWNYGVYGQLSGSNNGAAIYGVIPGYGDEDTQGKYAGYFLGGVYMNSQLSIGYKTASYALDVNGYIRGYNLTPSDERLKDNIHKMSEVLPSLTKLQGVTYHLKHDGIGANSNITKASSIMKSDTGVIKNSKVEDTTLYNRSHIGFLAQDVQKVYPELVYKDKDGILSVDYISLIPVLVESIKELNSTHEKDSIKLLNLEERIASLENKLDQCCGKTKLKDAVAGSTMADNSTTRAAVLYQNSPNPFNQTTTIAYYLPENVNNANLYIYNMQGLQIKVISIVTKGSGNVLIDGGELKPGMYLYSLIADGKEIDTKRMILTQ